MGIVGCMSIRVMGLRSRAGLGEIGANRDEVDVLVAWKCAGESVAGVVVPVS